VIRARDAHLLEEDIRQFGVVVLPGVEDRLCKTGPAAQNET